MAPGNLFLGIDFLEGVDSAMERIPHRNRFFLYERDRGRMYQIKKPILAFKIEVSWATI
jgi:hypothetical protein